MFGWIVILAAVTIMVKVSEMEGRSTTFWGALTFLLCILCSAFIPLPLINIVLGLILSYTAMFILKLLEK